MVASVALTQTFANRASTRRSLSQREGPSQRVSFAPLAPLIDLVTGAPYSAVRHAKHEARYYAERTRAVSPEVTTQVCRDSQGRTYTDRTIHFSQTHPGEPDALLYEIRDPVAGVQYLVDTANRVAHRFPLRVVPEGTPNVRPPISPETLGRGLDFDIPGPHPHGIVETLGTRIIEGEPTFGTRSIVTIPAGARGNTEPILISSEFWMSAQLKIAILTRSTDPTRGYSELRIMNISHAEPDPKLFVVPMGYAIVDETGGFTVTFNFQ